MAGRSSMWRFDPVRIGRAECDAWVGYYRHEWGLVLRSAVVMVREGFAMALPRTLLGAWLVLRANQLWAPYPDNDPDGAQRCMRAFYALVRRRHGEPRDIDQAARLEIEWWRAHRERDGTLPDALAALYAHVYDVSPGAVRQAARERAAAMDVSDAWVEAGSDRDDPRVAE